MPAVDGDCRDERHDGHEGLHQHAAVADQAGLALLLDQLRCGAGGDQRVEPGQRAAGDRDEQEREQRRRRTTGPLSRPANSLKAGTVISGRTTMMASASITITPIFMNVER